MLDASTPISFVSLGFSHTGRHVQIFCPESDPCPSSIHLDGTAVRGIVKGVVFEDSSTTTTENPGVITCGPPDAGKNSNYKRAHSDSNVGAALRERGRWG